MSALPYFIRSNRSNKMMQVQNKILMWLALGCLCLVPVTAGAAKNGTAAPSGPQITWQKWSPEAFAKAKRENKMILLSVGIEVCFACRWMEEFTYQDPRVVRLVMDGPEVTLTVPVVSEAALSAALNVIASPTLSL